MLVEAEKLEDQLRQPADAAVREAYLTLAHARLPDGMTVRPAAHGYISRELRFEMDGAWVYSSVLNQKWILWYFRRPALNAGLVDLVATCAHFPSAEKTSRNEIKLRLCDSEGARAVLHWIGASVAS